MKYCPRCKQLAAGSVLLLWGLIGAAAAEPMTATAPIVAVTVFPDRAAIEREVDLTLPAGAHTVQIGGLPSNLDTRSLQVSGTADGTLRIGAVELKTAFSAEPVMEKERQLRAAIRDLEQQRQTHRDKVSALQVQLDFIKSLGQKKSDQVNDAIRGGSLDPGSWERAWTTIGGGAAETYAAMREAQHKEQELSDAIQKKRQELTQIQTGRRATSAALIHVQAEGELAATLKLVYQVGQASWQPAYEARLDSDTGRLALTQVGQVRQGTGETWEDVRLTLSTARPGRGTGVRPLNPWFIDFTRPRARVPSRAMPSAPSAMKAPGAAQAPAEAKRPMQAAQPVTAQTQTTAFTAEYQIPGRVTVPADRSPHRFPINTKHLETKLIARTIPKRAPKAYLYAEADYSGAEPLLPGTVSLYRDGMFTGTTRLDLLRPGQSLELAFGVDDRLAVDYQRITDRREEAGLVNKRIRHERRYRITVHNHHQRPLSVTVLDQIPEPKDERIEVKLSGDSTEPDERNVDDRPGVLAWKRKLSPDQEWTIDFAYEVSFPIDKQVPGF